MATRDEAVEMLEKLRQYTDDTNIIEYVIKHYLSSDEAYDALKCLATDLDII